MEPRLNVKIADLWMEPGDDAPNPVDTDFIPQGVQMDNDFIDADSNDKDKNWEVEQAFRADWAAEIDRDNASGQQHGRDDSNPAQQTAPYGMAPVASKQASGFRKTQLVKMLLLE